MRRRLYPICVGIFALLFLSTPANAGPRDPEIAQYRTALDLYSRGFVLASSSRLFARVDPESPYGSRAQMFMGVALVLERRTGPALRAFERVTVPSR
jgi:hypothetical protein